MRRELADEILALIEARSQAEPTAMEFEMAYQARVASDRIRFAIQHTEQFAPHTDQMREAALQLLDALERLELAERKFQERSRASPAFRLYEVEARAANGARRGGQQRDGKGDSV
jgi:hypothetical protein